MQQDYLYDFEAEQELKKRNRYWLLFSILQFIFLAIGWIYLVSASNSWIHLFVKRLAQYHQSFRLITLVPFLLSFLFAYLKKKYSLKNFKIQQ